jgi:pimeloyl-ACP methyl ester carboxylesterase
LLVNSGPGFKNPRAAEEWRRRSERTADVLEQAGLEAFVAGKAGATCVGRKPELPAARAGAAAIIAQDPRGVAEFGRRVAGLAPSVIDELAEIAVHVLVLVGEEDRHYLQAGEVMASKLPNADHKLLAGAGHVANIEEAEAFNAVTLEFLRGLEA